MTHKVKTHGRSLCVDGKYITMERLGLDLAEDALRPDNRSQCQRAESKVCLMKAL